MTRLGTVPIYFETNDKRVLAYLRKNALHHELIQRQGVTPQPQPLATGGDSEGWGYIRYALAGVIATPFLYGVLWWVLAFANAMTMEIPQ